MKKLMIAMAAVAMVSAANADASYNYAYNIQFTPYTAKDTKPSDDHVGWYSCYGMTQATAQELLDTKKTVTYSDVATWLGQNFAVNSEDVEQDAQALTENPEYAFEIEQYRFMDTVTGSRFDFTDDYIGVVLFNNGTDLAYNVLSALSDGGSTYFRFDDSSSSSGWQPVENVPEPTSGLLMLLGMAGLCLRRKQRG